MAITIYNLQFIAIERFAATAGANIAGTIGEEDVIILR